MRTSKKWLGRAWILALGLAGCARGNGDLGRGAADTGGALTWDAAQGQMQAGDDVGGPDAGSESSGSGVESSDGTVVGADDAAGSGRTFTVIVGPNGDHVFSPPDLTINVNDTVHWEWASSGHNVSSGRNGNADSRFCSPSDTACDTDPTSLAGSNPLSDAGATYDHRFTAQGTYPYFCRPHYAMGMMGQVTVQSTNDADVCLPPGALCSSPVACCSQSCASTPGSGSGLACL
jgi:plastocyanin